MRLWLLKIDMPLFQSTLPQGERHQVVRWDHSAEHFNPRSHKGSDLSAHPPFVATTEFQSTLPQGERHLDGETLKLCSGISIHAPTRGATYSPGNCRWANIFQSTLPQGERQTRPGTGMDTWNFNPRSHKGSDSNFTQNSISVLFHFYQSFPHIIFPHTARFRLLIIFCTFFLVRIAQRFPVCFHFAPKQYPAFYNVCSTDLL